MIERPIEFFPLEAVLQIALGILIILSIVYLICLSIFRYRIKLLERISERLANFAEPAIRVAPYIFAALFIAFFVPIFGVNSLREEIYTELLKSNLIEPDDDLNIRQLLALINSEGNENIRLRQIDQNLRHATQWAISLFVAWIMAIILRYLYFSRLEIQKALPDPIVKILILIGLISVLVYVVKLLHLIGKYTPLGAL